MDLIERNNSLKKVEVYLRQLFIAALSQNTQSSSDQIQQTINRIMRSIKIVVVSEREFVISKGLFEVKFNINQSRDVEVRIRRISLKEKADHYLKEIDSLMKDEELQSVGSNWSFMPGILGKPLATILALFEIGYRTVNYPGLNSQMRIFLESKAEPMQDGKTQYFELHLNEA